MAKKRDAIQSAAFCAQDRARERVREGEWVCKLLSHSADLCSDSVQKRPHAESEGTGTPESGGPESSGGVPKKRKGDTGV